MALSSTTEQGWTNNWVTFEWHLANRNQLKQALWNNWEAKNSLVSHSTSLSTLGMCSYCQSGIAYQWKAGDGVGEGMCLQQCNHLSWETHTTKGIINVTLWSQQLWLFCVPSWNLLRHLRGQVPWWHPWLSSISVVRNDKIPTHTNVRLEYYKKPRGVRVSRPTLAKSDTTYEDMYSLSLGSDLMGASFIVKYTFHMRGF